MLCVIMLYVLSAIQTVDKMSAYKMTFDKMTRRLAKELKEIKSKVFHQKFWGIGQLTRGKSAHTQTFQNFFLSAISNFPK